MQERERERDKREKERDEKERDERERDRGEGGEEKLYIKRREENRCRKESRV